MRRLAAILLTVTCIVFVSACSSSKHAAPTTTTSTPATSAPNGSTVAPTTQPGGATSQPGGATSQPGGATSQPPTTAASNACRSSNLKLALGSAQGAAGHTYTSIIFTNTGTTTCTMIGYPGVSNVSVAGAQVGAAADRMVTSTPHVVTLAAGEHTTATLEETNLGIQSGCEQSSQTARAAAILVYPPNNTVAIKISRSKQVCSNPSIHQLSITAVGSTP